MAKQKPVRVKWRNRIYLSSNELLAAMVKAYPGHGCLPHNGEIIMQEYVGPKRQIGTSLRFKYHQHGATLFVDNKPYNEAEECTAPTQD